MSILTCSLADDDTFYRLKSVCVRTCACVCLTACVRGFQTNVLSRLFSLQMYNSLDDYQKLADAVLTLLQDGATIDN